MAIRDRTGRMARAGRRRGGATNTGAAEAMHRRRPRRNRSLHSVNLKVRI